MGRIILFVRVSTLGQQLESQEDSLRRAALADGHNESDFIVISNKESAIKLSEEAREGLNDLKRVIESEDVSHIYIAELSRLSRVPSILYSIREQLKKKRIQLKCLHPQFSLLTEDRTKYDDTANIIFSLFGALAEQEMLEKKERFARGKRQKAKEGKFTGGRIPFGYRAYPERDNFIDTDEKEMEIVKLIYNLYTEEGYSQPRIAIELRERGYTNPRYKKPRIIQLGQISNILSNKCYTGEPIEEEVIKVKDKRDGNERVWVRYPRKFPQIIPVEQYNKCRDIAKANRTLTGKGKNIYYATRLVKCPSCGCYWSASGSKVCYHCYNAANPPKIWAVNGRTTEQCTNRTSLSINVLDSILWYFAKREEASFIQQASRERIEALRKSKTEIQEKIDAIPAEIDRINEEINKLALRNAEGYLSDDTFEERVTIKNREKSQIIDKKLSHKKRIEELDKAIVKISSSLTSYGVNVKHIDELSVCLDIMYERIKQFNEIYNTVNNITGDTERYEIIHRVINSVSVENVIIKYKYKSGWREARAKKIVIVTPDWYLYDTVNMLAKEYIVYYLPFNGKDKGIIIDTKDSFSTSANRHGSTIVDDDGEVIGHSVDYEWVKDYKITSEAQLENEDVPHPVSIIDIPYLNRFTDYGKNKRIEREKEEAYRPVKDYLRVEEVMSMGNLKSGQVYGAIYRGILKAQIIRHKCFISPVDAERFIAKLNEERNSKGDKLPAFEIAKRFNVHYLQVLRRVKNGKLPSEYINGEYLVSLKDAERYFSTEHENEGRRDMDGKLSAAMVAKKYGVSYKSVRKLLRTGEIPSSKIAGYFYVDPKDADDYFGK